MSMILQKVNQAKTKKKNGEVASVGYYVTFFRVPATACKNPDEFRQVQREAPDLKQKINDYLIAKLGSCDGKVILQKAVEFSQQKQQQKQQQQ